MDNLAHHLDNGLLVVAVVEQVQDALLVEVVSPGGTYAGGGDGTSQSSGTNAEDGVAGSGGGGGSGCDGNTAGGGGPGIVIIRYQN